jgi:hypothetical protein
LQAAACNIKILLLNSTLLCIGGRNALCASHLSSFAPHVLCTCPVLYLWRKVRKCTHKELTLIVKLTRNCDDVRSGLWTQDPFITWKPSEPMQVFRRAQFILEQHSEFQHTHNHRINQTTEQIKHPAHVSVYCLLGSRDLPCSISMQYVMLVSGTN